MPPEKYYDEQYSKDFLSDKKLNKEALERALDIRKFEIDLYWKRATYFWTFIAATLAGFVVVQASAASNKEAMSVLLACLGIVFSVGWVCVNRGSKFWQENWESHVDMLEDEIGPPLYKVVISKQGTVGLERLSHFPDWSRKVFGVKNQSTDKSVRHDYVGGTFVLLASAIPMQRAHCFGIYWPHCVDSGDVRLFF